MRWFKHLSRAHLDDKLSQLLASEGLEGYGFYFLLLEHVADALEKTGQPTLIHPLSQWSRMLYCHHHRVEKALSKLGVIGLVNLDKGSSNFGVTYRVTIPNLLKYRDEYQQKSRHAPDKLGTLSGHKSTENRVQRTDNIGSYAAESAPTAPNGLTPDASALAADSARADPTPPRKPTNTAGRPVAVQPTERYGLPLSEWPDAWTTNEYGRTDRNPVYFAVERALMNAQGKIRHIRPVENRIAYARKVAEQARQEFSTASAAASGRAS